MLWNREPVMFVAAFQALLAALVVFGLNLSVEQTAGLMALAAAVLGLIVRQKVSPVVES